MNISSELREQLKDTIRNILIEEGMIVTEEMDTRKVELEALYSSVSNMFIRKGPSGNGLLDRKQLIEITKHMLQIAKILGIRG